ncbi:hypothetical protein Q4610_20065 [Sphingobium sp. HBC34]|uniref:HNH endonuclease 5 domain-containing protein n=1 Tax=Sphingobium cyanobacteriorum TaxID=3063954 RepID=A0ABT8ZS32_9SPHN|nr:hypothetical protein [Sphingobium sp. HBC34]MDO7837345.1 hypothetical protein [Sphingobium sp. HBC34]
MFTRLISEHRVMRDAPTRRYPEVGQCIYCFKKPPEVVLTDEHIIADGLRGDLLLPKASCVDCAHITGRIEQLLMRRMLEQPRGALGLRSRKKHARKLGMKMHVSREGGPEIEKEVPHDGMPPFFIAFVGDHPPGILTGAPPGTEWSGRVMIAMPADAQERGKAALGNSTLRFGFHVHAGVFSQAIAKAAYAYAVAELGMNQFDPFLANYCIADEPAFDSHHIAALMDISSDNALHHISLQTAYARSFTAIGITTFPVFVVHVKLFTELSTPRYVVVVGRPKAPQ